MKPPTDRNAMIAKIHVAKAQLGLDDAAYRAMLKSITGKESCAQLSASDLSRVLDAVKDKGWKPKAAKKAKSKAPLADSDQAKKIRALWLQLRNLGVLRDSSEKALGSYIHRMTGVSALNWLSPAQCSRVIEALKKWIARVEEERVVVDGPTVAL
jgi:phage gp16-like protein